MSEVFSGGQNLILKLQQLLSATATADEVHIGFLQGSMAGWNGPRPVSRGGKKGSQSKGNQQPAAMVAFILEYGAPEKGIAPYPFFSRMISKRAASWKDLVANALRRHQYNAAAALKEVGLVVSEQLVASIQEQEYEGSNAEGHAETIARKGGKDTPLRDSGNLMHAVDYIVTEK